MFVLFACVGTQGPCYNIQLAFVVYLHAVCSLFLHCKRVVLPYLFAACSLPRYIKHVACVARKVLYGAEGALVQWPKNCKSCQVLDGCFLTLDSDCGVQVDLVRAYPKP